MCILFFSFHNTTDYEICLTWDIFELVFNTMDKISPKTSDMIFTQTLNKRVGTTGLNMKELLYASAGIEGLFSFFSYN
jgi:hypothetical protein